MNSKPVQYFSREYLQRCKALTPDQIIEFEENFRNLMAIHSEDRGVLNLTLDPVFLKAFKAKAEEENVPYEDLIKKLMTEWLSEE